MRRDTVFCTELANAVPPVRKRIEHVVELNPGQKSIHVPRWRQRPEQRAVNQEWTKDMNEAVITCPSKSPFSTAIICVKIPVE